MLERMVSGTKSESEMEGDVYGGSVNPMNGVLQMLGSMQRGGPIFTIPTTQIPTDQATNMQVENTMNSAMINIMNNTMNTMNDPNGQA